MNEPENNNTIDQQNATEQHQNFSRPSSNDKSLRSAQPKGRGKLIASLIIIILFGACGTVFWYIWQKEKALNEQLSFIESQLEEYQSAISSSESQYLNLQNALAEQERVLAERILINEQLIQAQHKKLSAMSTTSREDWLLAEAEYLLRLANQRVLIERSPRNADALLVNADEILRDIDDPDLYALRQALAKDLAQLRLVIEIDRNGLFFSLKALAEEIENVDMRPDRQQILGAHREKAEETTAEDSKDKVEEPLPFWTRLGRGMKGAFSGLNQYIRLSKHDEPPQPLMEPEAAVYLKQNLRLKLERAQLALLREEQEIYESSLQEAISWLKRYFPASKSVTVLVSQIEKIQNQNIVQTLPDISYSLELLHIYIENLHRVEGLDQPKTNKELEMEGDTL